MAALASTDVTYTFESTRRGGVRPRTTQVVKLTFGDSILTYPSGGVPLTKAKLGLPEAIESFNIIDADDATGIVWKYDFANNKLRGYQKAPALVTGTIDDNDNAATLGHTLYVIPVAEAPRAAVLAAQSSPTPNIQYDMAAASLGVITYIVIDDADFTSTYALGHFEFVSPTNANGTCTLISGGPTLTLFDDDAAATNGVAVRAVAASGGLEATFAASKNCLVPVSTGTYIWVNHATTGGAPTVYFDEDGGNTFERLMAVVADGADEPYALYVETSDAVIASGAEIAPQRGLRGFPLSQIVTSGPKPFTYAVGASPAPTILIAACPEAASVPGASLLFVQAAEAGFNSSNFGKRDTFVETSTGACILVTYAASPLGVQCYGYPEGATTDLTILGVIVDNADESFYLSRIRGTQLGTSLIELSSTAGGLDAPAAQTLYIEATGY